MAKDLSPAQREAVERAVRATRRQAELSLGADDRRQIAALAVLEIRVDADRGADEQRAFLDMRARGAVLDALRLERRDGQLHGRTFGYERDYAPDEGDEFAGWPHAAGQPEQHEELRRVAVALDGLTHARRTVAWGLAEGRTPKEIAAELSVSVSRVGHLRIELCNLIREMTTCLS